MKPLPPELGSPGSWQLSEKFAAWFNSSFPHVTVTEIEVPSLLALSR